MLGLGRFVNNNVLPPIEARGFQVVAAADPDPAARDRVARSFGIERIYPITARCSTSRHSTSST